MIRRNSISRRELLSYGLSLGGVLLPSLGTQVLADTSTDPVMESSTDLLIIGAGPFGLALAAFAQENSISHQVVGVCNHQHDPLLDRGRGSLPS